MFECFSHDALLVTKLKLLPNNRPQNTSYKSMWMKPKYISILN